MLIKVQPASSPCCPALPRHCLNIDQGREETIVHSVWCTVGGLDGICGGYIHRCLVHQLQQWYKSARS